MKKLTALLLMTAVSLSLAACSGGSGETADQGAGDGGSQSASSGAENSGDRPIKDEIVFAQSSDLTTMNPYIGTQERAYSLTNHMYDTLLEFDSEMNMHNSLAESYEWLDDLTLQIKLREGVTFHNGDPLTAEDVIFTFEKRAERGSAYANYIDVAGMEAQDDLTVIVPFTSPHPSFIYQLTDPAFGIVPKNYFESVGEEGFAKDPIGSGPYKLKEYVTGDYYMLERYEDYWGEPAKTQYLTMRIVPEAGQRTIMLETGEIDVAYEVPYVDAAKIQDNPDLQFLSTPSMKIVMFYVNTDRKSVV